MKKPGKVTNTEVGLVVDFGEREEAVNAQDTCWEVFGWHLYYF